MTAITIVRDLEGIAIASDGAAYDDAGLLRQIVTKVEVLPHLSLVIASTGSQLAAYYFRDLLFWMPVPPQSFDEVIEIASDLSRDVFEFVKREGAPSTQMFSLYFCGYSTARERMETYGLKSQEWPNVIRSDGSTGTAEAFEIVKLPAIHCAPAPPVELAALFGITVPGKNMTDMPDDGAQYAMKAVSACRFAPGGPDHMHAQADPFCCVGGFLQLTRIGKTHIVSEIIHRWPDVIGERMDMERGEMHERAPLWLLKPLDEPAALPADQS